MFKTIKGRLRIITIGAALIITAIMQLVTSYSTGGEMIIKFNTSELIALGVLILFIYIFLGFISKYISFPLKRIERSMAGVIEGNINEVKGISNYSKVKEITDIATTFNDMVKVIRNNNFDLNSQQSKTEIILEQMDDGVVAFSVDRKVVHMNGAAMTLLGLSKDDEEYEKITRKIGVKVDFDKVIYLPNHKSIEDRIEIEGIVLKIVLVPFYSSKFIPMGVILIVKNITESVRLDNMRKEFVANVSHELKTPLTSIKGYSETILAGGLNPEEQMQFTKVINNEANRMNKLVGDLLKLSRFDYQKNNWNKTKFNLDDLVKSVVQKMEYIAEQKNHTLKCIVNIVPPQIVADKDSIEQVITNLVSNSIKYTPDGGEINVFVGSIAGKAYVKVIDTGIGIPEKDLSRIFERFYRVDKARSREIGGTGLGLSIVKEIIDGNGGTIEIKSEVGKGTEVVLIFEINR